MDRKEVKELIFTILKDQNFDFKSYPYLMRVNYHDYAGRSDFIISNHSFLFQISFYTTYLDLDYETIQIFVDCFLKFLKISNFKEGEIIYLSGYNEEEFQNLIDQYYFEMFGEENKIIQCEFSTWKFTGHMLRLFSNNSDIEAKISLSFMEIKAPFSEIQLEEYIKLLRSYEQWIKKKLKS